MRRDIHQHKRQLSAAEAMEVCALHDAHFTHHWPNIAREMDLVPHIWAPWWTKEYLFEAVLVGRVQCWAVGPQERIQLIIFTQIAIYPAARILQSLFILGNGLDEGLPVLAATLKRFAELQDCAACEVTGRKGWKKKLASEGFVQRGVVLECPVQKQRLN